LVPERTSQDRIQLLKSLGVEIVRTPIEAHADAAESQFSIAKKIVADLSGAILVDEVCIGTLSVLFFCVGVTVCLSVGGIILG
jgi:cystathionine beta-synthase